MRRLAAGMGALACIAALLGAPGAGAGVGTGPMPRAAVPVLADPAPIATDPLTSPGSQHQSVVEPHTAAWGSTIVSTYQVGRYAAQGSGAAATGWATSTDAGATWTTGVLTGINTATTPAGIYPRSVNETVAYDAAHGQWLIVTLGMGLVGTSYTELEMFVARSSDGIHWSDPISIVASDGPDKSWVTCDNHPASRFYGRCYIAYSSVANAQRLQVVRSDDGGLTWSAPVATPSLSAGYDTNPVVRPDGTLVVLVTRYGLSTLAAFRSLDGGVTLTNPTTITTITKRALPGGLRTRSKPSAAVDDAGNVYVAWYDCRFRAGCTSNDIVVAASPDGRVWGAPTRVAVDPVTSSIDHWVAGLGVRPGTTGAVAQLDVVFYETVDATCTTACAISAVTSSSLDAGQTWSPARTLSPAPMAPTWFPATQLGRMVADYLSVGYSNGIAWTTLPIAAVPVGATGYRQALWAAPLSAPSLAPVALDDFNRAAGAGWGKAPVGGTWSATGVLGNTAVDGSIATSTLTLNNTTGGARLKGLVFPDADVHLRVTGDRTPTGTGYQVNVVGRAVATGTEYRLRLRFGATRLYVTPVRLDAGVQTTVGTEVASSIVPTPGQWVQVRFELVGSAPTQLRAKVWLDGQPEPVAWLVDRSDATPSLQLPGGVGVLTAAPGTTPVPLVVGVDDLAVYRAGDLPG